jgi:hypothetical protein
MHRRPCLRVSGLICLIWLSSAGTLRGEVPAPLAPLQFLLGDWEGVGDQAGATGGFSFALRVQDRVIVRTNYSDRPASGTEPASRHDDLMVIYEDAGRIKAEYFDSEGHIIRYVAEVKGAEVVFLSELRRSEPRYRLTYTQTSPTLLLGKFDVASPARPDAFAPYLSWTARKVK